MEKVKKSKTAPRARPASQAGGIVRQFTDYVEEHPFASVIVAFGVGILATTMLHASGVNLARLLTPSPQPEDDFAD